MMNIRINKHRARPSFNTATLIGVVGLCLLLIHSSLYAAPENNQQAKAYGKLRIGDQAHDFTLKSFQGENIRLFEQRGNIVLILFWAPWSGSSIRLLDQFETLQNKYGEDGLKVISISIEPDKSINTLNKLEPQHYSLLDTDTLVSRQHAISTIPSLYLVNRSGEVTVALEGFDPRYIELVENKIIQLLDTEN